MSVHGGSFHPGLADLDATSPRRSAETEGERVSPNCVARGFAFLASFMAPGYGMFSEAYVVFSIGNVQTIFKTAYKQCWGKHETCTEQLTESTKYTEVGGIILGMLLISQLADILGRRVGSICTSCIMLIGVLGMMLASGPSEAFQTAMFTIALAVFGFGVGGEYPLASASAAERAERNRQIRELRSEDAGRVAPTVNDRGKTVVLTFSMQGVGNWINGAVLLLLLWLTGTSECGGANSTFCDKDALDRVWRGSYMFAVLGLLFLGLGRYAYLPESTVWLARRRAQQSRQVQQKGLTSLMRHYWHRLCGCAIGWAVWDFAFYGNKLFQGTIIAGISGEDKPDLGTVLAYTMINSTFALAGYYVAAFTIDKQWMGRRRMQNMGFIVTCIMFMMCGVFHSWLTDKEASDHAYRARLLQVMYYLSSFFGQWGPNATTWLLPSECFPTEVRAQAHGISAATGKVGGLLSAFFFATMSDQWKFLSSSVCGLIGFIVTSVFIPDVTSLDLHELDKRWDCQEHGGGVYSGPAIEPANLSLYERWFAKSRTVQDDCNRSPLTRP